jgi:hypothetical protein
MIGMVTDIGQQCLGYLHEYNEIYFFQHLLFLEELEELKKSLTIRLIYHPAQMGINLMDYRASCGISVEISTDSIPVFRDQNTFLMPKQFVLIFSHSIPITVSKPFPNQTRGNSLSYCN